YIAVSSVDVNGDESYKVYGMGTPYSIPMMPSGFTDAPGWEEILFSWNANQELDLAGYHLYRSSPPSIAETMIGGLITSTSYLDADFPTGNDYYFYRLCAVDTDGNESPITEPIRTRRVTLNAGTLLVNETLPGSGNTPFQPSPAQVTSFMEDLMSPFQPATIDFSEVGSLRISDIGIYQSIMWYSFDQSDNEGLFNTLDALSDYISYGGKVFISTYFPTLSLNMNSGYPAYFDYDSSINSIFGIASANYSTQSRFKYAIPLDSAFPALTVDPQKTTASMNGHIFKIESISASNSAQNIYTFGSDYENSSNQGFLNGLPVGVLHDLDPGMAFTISFPLYNMQIADARALVEYVFAEIFGVDVSSNEAVLVPAYDLLLSPNYPNPFASHTGFEVATTKHQEPMFIGIYNLKGQLVKILWQGIPTSGKQHHTWQGEDNSGKTVANGIYLLKAEQGGKAVVRKIMKMK
ncbi:MAG: T9SS type A sorting domain-containing protein, partial [Candidatus Cloacimonadaceae bacterium]|nr:T9SS type A sorting domain-containing protein [Candidatus Cloacimonadaceae bacterium]